MSEEDLDVEEYRRRFGVDPPFLGEEMHCILCHKTERSDPKVEKNWFAFDMYSGDGRMRRVYVCPTCAKDGPPGVEAPPWTRVAG